MYFFSVFLNFEFFLFHWFLTNNLNSNKITKRVEKNALFFSCKKHLVKEILIKNIINTLIVFPFIVIFKYNSLHPSLEMCSPFFLYKNT